MHKAHNLSHSLVPVFLDGDVAAGTDGARVTSLAVVDTRDCESVIFIVALGAVVATGLINLWVKASDDSGSFGAGTTGDIETLVNVAGEGDNLCLVIEVNCPAEARYLRLDYQRTVANVTIGSITAVKNLHRGVEAGELAGRVVHGAEIEV